MTGVHATLAGWGEEKGGREGEGKRGALRGRRGEESSVGNSRCPRLGGKHVRGRLEWPYVSQ